MEGSSDKVYMFLAIITALALLAATGFAWAEFDEIQQTAIEDRNLFQ